MKNKPHTKRLPKHFRELSHQILLCANQGAVRIDFLQEIARKILDFSGCDAIELIVKETSNNENAEIAAISNKSFEYKIIPLAKDFEISHITSSNNKIKSEEILYDVFQCNYESTLQYFSSNGSFWTGDVTDYLSYDTSRLKQKNESKPHPEEDYKSIALIPISVKKENIGVLQLRSKTANFFTTEEIKLYDEITPTIGVAFTNHRTQTALEERVKELTCLYGIVKVAEQFDSSFDEILKNIVKLLPPAWQYPDITCGRIVFDGTSYTTPNFSDKSPKQNADIIVEGKNRGTIEVVYLKKRPILDEGPFLKEERSLIDAIAKQITLIAEKKQAALNQLKLQEQLRHADRLATIGQLAAGVAHEINEPLGNILGLAQLAEKSPGIPEQALQDLHKIVTVSLHARDIIRKLMMFARQKPPEKTRVNLNNLINEGLIFLESRCEKQGIKLIRNLKADIPEFIADPSQLNQVLVNLVVNSIHAMPYGGILTIETMASDNNVSIIVEDNGIGMSDEVKKQMFIPFYTTKDVGQGTGVGLSVVHGIVTSHGGSIKVTSTIDSGTRFEIQLPINETFIKEENR